MKNNEIPSEAPSTPSVTAASPNELAVQAIKARDFKALVEIAPRIDWKSFAVEYEQLDSLPANDPKFKDYISRFPPLAFAISEFNGSVKTEIEAKAVIKVLMTECMKSHQNQLLVISDRSDELVKLDKMRKLHKVAPNLHKAVLDFVAQGIGRGIAPSSELNASDKITHAANGADAFMHQWNMNITDATLHMLLHDILHDIKPRAYSLVTDLLPSQDYIKLMESGPPGPGKQPKFKFDFDSVIKAEDLKAKIPAPEFIVMDVSKDGAALKAPLGPLDVGSSTIKLNAVAMEKLLFDHFDNVNSPPGVPGSGILKKLGPLVEPKGPRNNLKP